MAQLKHGPRWAGIFDGQPVQAIRPLAASASNRNIAWPRTGHARLIRNVPAYHRSISESSLAPPEKPLDTPASACYFFSMMLKIQQESRR